MTDTSEYFRSWSEQSTPNPEAPLPAAPYSLPVAYTVLPRLFLMFTIPHTSKDLHKPKHIVLTELCSLGQIIFYFILLDLV